DSLPVVVAYLISYFRYVEDGKVDILAEWLVGRLHLQNGKVGCQVVSAPAAELLEEIVRPEEARPYLQTVAEYRAQAIAKVLAEIRNRIVADAFCVCPESFNAQMIHHKLWTFARTGIHFLHRRHGAKHEDLPRSRRYIPFQRAVRLHVCGQIDRCAGL